MTVSIKDIAKKAKVSPMAVSLGLRDLAGVSQQKRKEIKRLAKEMGYHPNFLGRGLQGGRTYSVGVLWSLRGSHVSVDLTRDITLRAQKRGYISYVVDSLSDPDITEQTLDNFIQRRVDAVVIQYNDGLEKIEVLSKLKAFSSVVMVGRMPRELPFDVIHHDCSFGIRQIAQHLILRNRHRPAVFYCGSRNRYKAETFIREFREKGIDVLEDAIIELPSCKSHDILRILDSKFLEGISFDSIFCQIDYIAMTVMKWLKFRGVRIPEDIAVIGFDDTDFCDCVNPSLASVSHEHNRLSEEIDRLIFSRIDKPDLLPRKVSVPMAFVHRESAG